MTHPRCRKNTFGSRAAAKRFTREQAREYGHQVLHAYRCEVCALWHLSSQRPRDQRRIERKLGKR